MNKVILLGRLTREPQINYTQGERQMCVARFTLAVDRRIKNNNGDSQADFISCLAFEKSAEFVEKYLHQGSKIALVGRIQTGSYTKQDGTRVYTTDVVVETVEFAESKANSETNNTAEYQNQQYYQQKYKPQEQNRNTAASSARSNDGFMNIPDGVEDDDLPFN